MTPDAPTPTRRRPIRPFTPTLCALTAALVATAGPDAPHRAVAVRAATARSQPTVCQGRDDAALDEANAHYRQRTDGSFCVDYFAAEAGVPGLTGWRPRDPTLLADPGAPDGIVQPRLVSFALTIPHTIAPAIPHSADSAIAMTSEDDAQLGVGIVTVGGLRPRTTLGHMQGNAIVYRSILPHQDVDLTVRATVIGYDLRLTLWRPLAAPTVTLTLDPATDEVAGQDGPDGIVLTRASTTGSVDSSGTSTVDQPEFILGSATITDAAGKFPDPARLGPVRLQAQPGRGGAITVRALLDARWLSDRRRVYPVTLDLPVTTATATLDSPTFGVVTDCAPATPALLGPVAVGQRGRCASQGILYIDPNLSGFQYSAQVSKAYLYVDTPTHTGPAGITLYAGSNVRVGDTTIANRPTWAALGPLRGTGIAEDGASGTWQRWDVTALVSGWIAGTTDNSGLRLVRHGPPLVLASPFGPGIDAPSTMPRLVIFFTP